MIVLNVEWVRVLQVHHIGIVPPASAQPLTSLNNGPEVQQYMINQVLV